MNNGLPEGWATARLAEVVTARKGKKPGVLRDTPSKGFVPYLDIHAIEKKVVRQFAEIESSNIAAKDDLFVVWDGARSGWTGGGITGAIGSTIMALTARQMESCYLRHFIASKFQTLNTNTRGTGIPHVDPGVFWNLDVPVAPLPEQQRIVVKLEKLLDRVDTSKERLKKIPVLLKRFRQSIYDAAVTGKLTAKWRISDGRNEDPLSDLKSFLTSVASKRPQKREAEPTEGHETLTDEIPEKWATPTLDDLFRFIDYRGKTPKKSEKGKRLISAKNIKMGYVSEEPLEYVSDMFYRQWMTRGFPRKGDIFFVTEGHTMGFTALNNRTDEFALSQRTITLQPWQPIETSCFLYFIMSPLFQNLVRLNATGSAAVGIKAAKFRGLPIPFPSHAEQKIIVKRVEALFSLADEIESRLNKAQAFVDKLTPSVLAKAFRGDLVPQDPNDEPAERLLEGIRSAS
jgi:type I restriction enzyme S subunit